MLTGEFPVLQFHDAASAALDDAKALADMEGIWQDNLTQMAEAARRRGWAVTGPARDAGLSASAITALETQLGEQLPPQLRWALGRTSRWVFGWRCSPTDEPKGGLASCCSGGIRGAIWDVQGLMGLREAGCGGF